MKLLLFSLFLLATSSLFGVQIRGFIYDENKETIPFASVSVLNSTYGVSANVNGEYVIDIKEGAHHLVFEALGFEKKVVPIEVISNTTLDIELNAIVYEIEDVEINYKKDPAYAIIKSAIKAKDNFKDSVNSFVCDNYIKSSLSKSAISTSLINDNRLNFTETSGQVYYLAPNHYKEVIAHYKNLSNEVGNSVAVRVSNASSYESASYAPVDPDLYYTHYSDASFNFLNNSIHEDKVSAIPLTSPISDFALLHYNYKFIETIYADSLAIHKISVTPKSKGSATFSGFIFIEAKRYYLKRVELNVNPQVLQYYSTFKLVQEYHFYEKTYLLPTRREFHYTVGKGNSQKIGQSIAYHNNYQINLPIDKKTFKNELYKTLDDAYDASVEDWEKIRPIELKAEEKDYIHERDSVEKVMNDPKRMDSLDIVNARLSIENIALHGVVLKNKLKTTTYEVDPLISSMNFLAVGGYRHKIGISRNQEFKNAHELKTSGNLSFGFNNADFRGEITNDYMYNPKKFARARVGLGDTYDMITFATDLNNIFARSNFVNKKFIRLGHQYEILNGFYLDLHSEYAQVNSIEDIKIEKWSSKLFPNNEPVAFEDYAELFINIDLSIRFNQKYYTLPHRKVIIGSEYPTLDIHYKRGIPELGGSVVDFDFLELRLRDDLQLGKFGSSSYRLKAGQFFNKTAIRILDYKYFRGGDAFYFSDPLNTFQLLDGTKSETNTFLEAHYIHHFNGFFTNQIPLVRKIKIYTLAGAGALVMREDNFKHLEMFAGFEKSFRIRNQLYKFITVGSSYISSEGFDWRIKFGIDFYNFNTKKWSY